MYSSLASSGSILPNILDVAQEHGLSLGNRTSRPDEVRVCCPFCGDSKYHLYLNTDKQVFNCYRCGEKGGVIRFIALLTGCGETEVIEQLKPTSKKTKKSKKKNHPATMLNTFQLKQIGYNSRPNWDEFFKKDPSHAIEYADSLWNEWQDFLNREKRLALRNLYIALKENRYGKEVEKIRERSKEIGVDLLMPCLNAYSEPFPEKWALEAKASATMWLATTLNPEEQSTEQLIDKATLLIKTGFENVSTLPVAVGIVKNWSQKTKTDLLSPAMERVKKIS